MDNYEKINPELYTIVRKPFLPPKVEHWIENYSGRNDLFNVVCIARDYVNGVSMSLVGDEDITRWVAENPLKFTSAWLNGYTPHEKK